MMIPVRRCSVLIRKTEEQQEDKLAEKMEEHKEVRITMDEGRRGMGKKGSRHLLRKENLKDEK